MRYLIILIIFFSCILTSCQIEDLDTNLKIGISIYKQDDLFISGIIDDITSSNEEDLKFEIMHAKSNQYSQNDQIDYFIKNDFDIICVNIVDRRAASNIINKAKKANIPLIFFNREPNINDFEIWDNVYYVGASAKDSGLMQGEMIVSAYRDNKSHIDTNNDGVIQYVLIEGELGHQDAILRSKYCIKKIKDVGIKTEKVENLICEWDENKSYIQTKELLKQNKHIEVIFSNNDEMAIGAIDAFVDSEKKLPVIIGVDGINSAFEYIKNGLMYGTVLNDSSIQAQKIIDVIKSIKGNKTHERFTEVNQEKIISESFLDINR